MLEFDLSRVFCSRPQKIEIAVDDSAEEAVISAIKSAAETGKIGDGKIFTLDLKETIRIRTGETGSDAL